MSLRGVLRGFGLKVGRVELSSSPSCRAMTPPLSAILQRLDIYDYNITLYLCPTFDTLVNLSPVISRKTYQKALTLFFIHRADRAHS